MKNKKKKKKKSTKKSYAGIIAFFTALLILVGLYVAVGFYFSSHFLPGTTLNNTDVSMMNVDEAKKALVKSVDSYVLTLHEVNNGKESIKSDEIGLKAEVSDDFNHIFDNQSGLMWIFNLFADKSYVLDEGVLNYSFDEGKMTDVIENLHCVNPKYPVEAQNAELVMVDGKFTITPDSIGNVAHREDLEDSIKNAVLSQKTDIDLEKEGLYDMPDITADDPELLAQKASCDGLIDMVITLKFGKNTEKIDINQISDWIEASKNKKGEFILKTDDNKIRAYIEELANKYDTTDKKKIFTNHLGNVVDVTSGSYGWLLDQDEAVKQLKKLVLGRKSAEMDLTDGSDESQKWWLRTAVNYDPETYYGNTYAEVSIAEQHMWLYQDGKVTFDSDVVTGNPNLGNSTPTGAFRIVYHQANAILRGPGYAQPVAYWMVFADDVGFHDATWQPYFGGDLYQWNGSHGCVNMPLDKAGVLFDLIYDNMPVFVY